jgi:hypothetical protein
MRESLSLILFLLGAITAVAAPATILSPATRPAADAKVIHVFVALCDNDNQGIAPVSAKLGNGQDPANNLYWGAMYGVKTFFRRSPDWRMLDRPTAPASKAVLERCCFGATIGGKTVYVVADAYDGAKMPEALGDFLSAAAGSDVAAITANREGKLIPFSAGGAADLVCFVGHNGLMDAEPSRAPAREGRAGPASAIVLACKSQSYFEKPLEHAGCAPLLTTTGLMAPEAYVLDAAVRAWAAGDRPPDVRKKAAAAYAKYQKCSTTAAQRLFGVEPQELKDGQP